MSKPQTTYSQVYVEWKSKNVFLLQNERVSDEFSLSGEIFYLEIWPKVITKDETAEWVSLYLKRRNKATRKYRVAFTMGIRKCDGSIFKSFSKISEFQETDDSHCSGYGEQKFLTITELLGSENVVSDDGYLTVVFCTAQSDSQDLLNIRSVKETASQTVSPENNEPFIRVLQENFKELFLSGRHGDVSIKVQDQEFHVHRSILATRSPVFSSMFDHDTEEKRTGIVIIPDFTPEIFKDFLSFLYTGNKDVVSLSNAVGLYKAADKYDLKDLKNKCVLCMTEELSSEIFCDVILLASMHNESNLLETATVFFIDNFKIIFPTSKWQSLMNKHTTLANELLIKMANTK